ncbi:hypothetical protein SLEP1_g2484 [Rubroshorea leprosula]|uniref:Uncharacterized protein n=1 Tax=Rubroshorea leprosula TaxID=152421 RepID=A0AAV5HHT0_9ROSI|nr:hypothetical protein SLEP1_g2484 [Rubroshorea leprosula]
MASSVHILNQDRAIIIKLLSALKTILVPVTGPPSTDRFTLKAMAAQSFSRVDFLEFQDRILSLVFSSPNIPIAINLHGNRTLESKEIPLQNGEDIIERLLLLLEGENHICPLSFLFEKDEKKDDGGTLRISTKWSFITRATDTIMICWVCQFVANAVQGGVRFGFDNRVNFQWRSKEEFKCTFSVASAVDHSHRSVAEVLLYQ